MALPQPHYVTGGASSPMRPVIGQGMSPCAAPVFSNPFPAVNIPYVLRQDFMCLANYWKPCPLNTPYDESILGGVVQWSELGGYQLCEESERQDIGGGCVRWTRTYAMKPETHYQPTSINYRFIQFNFPTISNGTPIFPTGGRAGFEETVTGQIQFEYFLLNDGEDLFHVQPIEPFRYYANQPNSVTQKLFTDFLLPAAYPAGTTIPSIEDYRQMVSSKTPIVAQPSQIRRWLGNFVERQTIYILPL